MNYRLKDIPVNQVAFYSDNMELGYAMRTVNRAETDTMKFDNTGIVLQKNRDGNWHYNPLRISAIATQLVLQYQLTPTEEIYKTLETYVNFLEHDKKIAYHGKGFPLYIYDFDFPLHQNQNETMKAPWHSGLAQGQMLVLISLLDSVFFPVVFGMGITGIFITD